MKITTFNDRYVSRQLYTILIYSLYMSVSPGIISTVQIYDIANLDVFRDTRTCVSFTI